LGMPLVMPTASTAQKQIGGHVTIKMHITVEQRIQIDTTSIPGSCGCTDLILDPKSERTRQMKSRS
jgi:hypothetical protein